MRLVNGGSPADVIGPDHPSETFRVLKERELREYGKYRMWRLVLEAWDRLVYKNIDSSKKIVMTLHMVSNVC